MSTNPIPETIALVLHFRDNERTSRCLASLSREGIRQVLLVDNSEDDGASLKALLAQGDRLCWSGLAIDLLDPGVNLGFSAGVNRGLDRIRELHGKSCVLLLNSDAELRPGAHAAMRYGIGAGLELATAWMVSPDDSRLACAYYQPYTATLSAHRWPGSFRYLSACCMLVGPTLAAKPLLDERFFFYGEDIELAWRLHSAGIIHDVVDGAAVDHEGSASSGNGSLFYEYHMARAHLLLPVTLARHSSERWGMFLGRALTLPLRATMRSVRSSSLAPWKGLLLATLHVMRGATTSIQPGRR